VTLRNTFEKAINANVRLSRATERQFHLATDKTLWTSFEEQATDLISQLSDGDTVLDLGGGRRCIYAHAVDPPGRVRLVAVDISAEELAANTDVSEVVVADISKSIPIQSHSANLLLSRALLEHVVDVPSAVKEMARVLTPGSTALHFVPCRYSLFGTAARIFPFEKLLRVTHIFMPWTHGQIEFPVKYDHCWPEALEAAFRSAGFATVETEVVWAQPGYFETIYPLFLMHALYEKVVRTLNLRKLASYTVVRAVR
jgi:ubiquinone/menaquinone biosynthesis C-methylase UbiE